MKTKTPFLKTLLVGLVFTLLGCTEETIIYQCDNQPQNLGKVNVYIEGDITDAECVAKLKAEVGTLTENIYVEGTTQLTSIEIDLPTNVRNLSITSDNAELKTIKVTGHGKMLNSNIGINGGPKCESVLVNGITEIKTIGFSNLYGIVNKSIICNDLEVVTKYFGIGASNGLTTPQPDYIFKCDDLKYISKESTNPNIETCTFDGRFNTFSMNSLKEVGGTIFSWLSGDVITFPELEKVYLLRIYSSTMFGLNTLNFPKLTTSYGIWCQADKLGTINLPVFTTTDGINLKDYEMPMFNFNAPSLSYCKGYTSNIQLSSEGVNAVLNRFLTIQPQSGKYIDLLQEVAPTGQGLTDKATLITQGNQVWTN